MIKAGFSPENLTQPLYEPIRLGETRHFNGCRIILRQKVIWQESRPVTPYEINPLSKCAATVVMALSITRNINMLPREAEYWQEYRKNRIKMLQGRMAMKYGGDLFYHRPHEEIAMIIGDQILDRIEQREQQHASLL